MVRVTRSVFSFICIKFVIFCLVNSEWNVLLLLIFLFVFDCCCKCVKLATDSDMGSVAPWRPSLSVINGARCTTWRQVVHLAVIVFHRGRRVPVSVPEVAF